MIHNDEPLYPEGSYYDPEAYDYPNAYDYEDDYPEAYEDEDDDYEDEDRWGEYLNDPDRHHDDPAPYQLGDYAKLQEFKDILERHRGA